MMYHLNSYHSCARWTTRLYNAWCRKDRTYYLPKIRVLWSVTGIVSIGTLLAYGQLNQNCSVSVLNRTVAVNPNGSWVLPNVPANFGQLKARATCTQNDITTSGESAPFLLLPNTAVNLPEIVLGNSTLIPDALTISPANPTLTGIGQSIQLSISAHYPDNSTKNVRSEEHTSELQSHSFISY